MSFAPLEILYQDHDLVAINKPAGLFVHRSFLDKHETEFALQLLRDQIGCYVYPIHRLDRPTSGVLLFALNEQSARQLGEQFMTRQTEKHYLAIVRGHMQLDVVVDYPLKEKLDKLGDKGVRLDKEPQSATTEFKPLAQATLPIAVGRYPSVRYSLVKAKPLTGRRHQIRRHLAHLRYPIIGDINYGDNKQNPFFRQHFAVNQLMLHASQLTISHPRTGQSITIQAKVDANWQNVLQRLDWQDWL